MTRLAALLAVALLAGCLRVGPGEDLHLVCEEKSASPRKAYGLDFLVAQTRVDDGVPTDRLAAMLEAARGHVVTPRGAPHAAFDAQVETLPSDGTEDARWLFRATGVWDERPPDEYRVALRQAGDGFDARAPEPHPGPVEASRTIRDLAWRAANASGVSGPFDSAAWDPDLPSCVTLRTAEGRFVANVVEQRLVSTSAA